MNTDNWINDRTIFSCVAGSRAYGLNTPSSDYDYRGVCIPPIEYYFGTQKFEQKDKGWPEKDKVVYGLHKFIELASKANPNILELMFMPDDCITHTSLLWEAIVRERNLFLTKKVKHTYSGYAFAQLKRIESHRKWLRNPPTHAPTREEFGLGRERLSNEYYGLLEITFKNTVDAIDIIDSTNEGGLDTLTKRELWRTFEKERKWRRAREEWESFQRWERERNPERHELEKKFGFDTKHASHCVRLMLQGLEILQKGTLSVRLSQEDRERCIGLKNGCCTYDALMEQCAGYNDLFECAHDLSTLPHGADNGRIEELLVGVTRHSMEQYPYGWFRNIKEYAGRPSAK